MPAAFHPKTAPAHLELIGSRPAAAADQTPKVSAAVIARVFLDPSLAIFQYNSERLLAETPTNIAFDDLQSYYQKMQASIAASKACKFCFATKVASIERGSDAGGAAPVRVHVEAASPTWRGGGDQLGGNYPVSGGGPRCTAEHAATEAAKAATAAAAAGVAPGSCLEFDQLIMACPADVARTLLGEGAGFFERRVLSSVEYFADLTVTHTDVSGVATNALTAVCCCCLPLLLVCW